MTSPKRRPFLRFSLRGLLIVMLLLCGLLGWKMHRVRQQRLIVQHVKNLGGQIFFDSAAKKSSNAKWTAWPRKWLGDDFFDHVTGVGLGSCPVEDVSMLRSLPKLQHLNVSVTKVRDLSPLAELRELKLFRALATPLSDLSPLANLPKLEDIEIEGANVTDVSPLAKMPQLRYLGLGHTKVQDVAPLAQLIQLEDLHLHNTPVTNPAELVGLINLKNLTLPTQTTQGDLAKLRQALPKCNIVVR